MRRRCSSGIRKMVWPFFGLMATLLPVTLAMAETGEWPTYAGGVGGWKYSSLDQIDAGNVHHAQVLAGRCLYDEELVSTTDFGESAVNLLSIPGRRRLHEVKHNLFIALANGDAAMQEYANESAEIVARYSKKECQTW